MDLTLYLITDSRGMDGAAFIDRVSRAVNAGVTMVQLREKELSPRELYARAAALKKICAAKNVPLIINDRADIALAADADGVHLGQTDLPIGAARRIMGKNKIIGATAKTIDAAAEAAKAGADYFGIGAFFATDTKSDAAVMTPEQIRAVTDAAGIPAVGIGGLTYENLEIISGSGVRGAAVSAAIMRAEDTEGAVKALLGKIRRLTAG